MPAEQKDVESFANANDEFNYSQFKTGLNGDQTMGRVQLTTTRDGAVSGDYLMKVDPRSAVFDQTLQALGSIHRYTTNTKDDLNLDDTGKPIAGGDNPFAGNIHQDVVDDSGREYRVPTQEYIYNPANPALDAQQQAHINANAATGLRRVNVKKNQGTLMERMVVRAQMDESYQRFEEAMADDMQEHNAAHVSADDRDVALGRVRFEGSDMVVSQVGVANLSHAQARKFHRSKHESKLNTTTVGA